LLWSAPPAWTRADAQTWAQERTWRLRQAQGVEGVDLVPLAPAGDSHPLWYEWLAIIEASPTSTVASAEQPRQLWDVVEELRGFGVHPVLLREA
jgi:hypothetical protein